MARPTPTLHEVAKAANVSIATVSRVLHGGDGVSQALQERVRAAVAELGYRPSHFGRALVQRRHGALGIVFPGLYGPYYSEVIYGIESVAVARQLAVVILGTHLLDGTTEHVLNLADRTDGLAILGGTASDDTVDQLIGLGKPVVLMAQHQTHDLPTLRVDNRRATAQLTHHLIDVHGLRRLAFLGDIRNSPDITDRWRGFLDGHAAAGLDAPEAPIPSGLEVSHGHHAALDLLGSPDRPDGIVCANDEIALGVLSAARDLDIDIPGEIAVTGWDDIPLAAHAHPSLTTVRQPTRELGARTASLLVDRIAGESADGAVIVLETEPIYRASCGCSPTIGSRAQLVRPEPATS